MIRFRLPYSRCTIHTFHDILANASKKYQSLSADRQARHLTQLSNRRPRSASRNSLQSQGDQTLILVRHHIDELRLSSHRSTADERKSLHNPSTRCLPPDTCRNVFGSLASPKSHLAKFIGMTWSSSPCRARIGRCPLPIARSERNFLSARIGALPALLASRANNSPVQPFAPPIHGFPLFQIGSGHTSREPHGQSSMTLPCEISSPES
jgi:hypothetical protein